VNPQFPGSIRRGKNVTIGQIVISLIVDISVHLETQALAVKHEKPVKHNLTFTTHKPLARKTNHAHFQGEDIE